MGDEVEGSQPVRPASSVVTYLRQEQKCPTLQLASRSQKNGGIWGRRLNKAKSPASPLSSKKKKKKSNMQVTNQDKDVGPDDGLWHINTQIFSPHTTYK